MLLVLLVKAQASLLTNLGHSMEAMTEKNENAISLLEMINSIKKVLADKVMSQISDHAGNFDSKVELGRLNEIKSALSLTSK